MKKLSLCLFLIFLAIFSFDFLKGAALLKQRRALMKEMKKEEVAKEEVQKLPALETFGYGYLSRIRNNTMHSLKVSTTGEKARIETIVTPGNTQSMPRDLKILESDIKVEGVGEQKVIGFTAGSAVAVQNGIAWMDEALKFPNKATLTFRAQAGKLGSIAAVFSDEISPDYTYKIIIGTKENTESVIIKKDEETKEEKIVFRVAGEVNPLARLVIGAYESFWITINDGLILVGKGSIGQNIFMSYFDVNFKKNINRIGFGALKTPVNFLDILVSPELAIQTDWQPYFESSGPPELASTKGNYTFLQKPLRVPGRGTFSFDVKGKQAAVAFGDNLEYQFVIGDAENTRTVLKKNNQIAAVISAKECPLAVLQSTAQFQSFWISIEDDILLFGSGNVGENLLFAWKDPVPIKISNRIAVGLGEFKNIKIGPSVNMYMNFKKEYYKSEEDLFKMPPSFTIMSPINYELFQRKEMVGIKDLTLEKTYNVAKITQHAASYFLMLVIGPDGLPKMENVRGPEPSPEVVQLARSAFIQKAIGEYAKRVGEEVSYGAGFGAGGFMALIGGAIISGIGAGLTKVGLRKESETKFGYQTDQDYAFVSNISEKAYAGMKIPDEALANKKEIDDIIKDLGLDRDEDVVLAAYRNILELINHPYVIDSSLKKRIFDSISLVYRAGELKKQDLSYYESLLRLLLDAYNNPFLVNVDDVRESGLKAQWYWWANAVARKMYDVENRSVGGFLLPPFFGAYFWVPAKFESPGQGKITFWAKALNDINICFARGPAQVRNSRESIYEIVIRGWKGIRSVIRVSSLGRPVATYNYSTKTLEQVEAEEAMTALDPSKLKEQMAQFKFRKYEVVLNNGRIIVSEDGKRILDWQDPYPISGVNSIGLGSWNVNVATRDFTVEAV